MARTTAARALRQDRAPRPAASTRPGLTLVAKPEPAGSVLPFVFTLSAIIVLTLAALLFLNIQMSDASYRITRLQGQSQRLTEEAQSLREINERRATPQELERRALAIGMVPVQNPAYIDLASGKVMGETNPAAQAAPLPSIPSQAAVPPAKIYNQPNAYRGMGNEGA